MAEVLTAPAYSVSAWIEDTISSSWNWGDGDCTLAVADYVLGLTGRDPAKRFRGRYRTAIGAQRLWRRSGGYISMIREEMEAAGFTPTTKPQHGDVGIVLATPRFRDQMPAVGTVAAVRAGKLWVVRAVNGVVAQDFETIAAWSMASWIRF